MHAPAPCADTSASAGGSVPFLPAVDARAASGGRSARLESILRRRDEYITETGDSIERDLARIADELGARIVEALESRGLGDIRVAVDTTTLEDVLDILYELGVNDSQLAWFERLRTLAGYAEDAAVAADLRREDVGLDQEGLAAALDARYQDAASWWDATIERPLAQGILDGLQDARALTTLDDLSARLSQRARISLPAAVTEAKTQTAVVDRFISAEIAASADPDGEDLRWGYVGPIDGIQRPFCRALVGRFFRRAELSDLDNGTSLPHPIFSCGGYNCRHSWVQAPAALLEARGLNEGGPADITRANQGASR